MDQRAVLAADLRCSAMDDCRHSAGFDIFGGEKELDSSAFRFAELIFATGALVDSTEIDWVDHIFSGAAFDGSNVVFGTG
jgi:hypothetical protein